MAEETPTLPAISVSRTSTDSTKNQSRSPDVQPTVQSSNRRFGYNKFGPPPWKSSFKPHTWGHQGRGPDLKWHIPWKKDCFATGRVLIIDYVGSDSETPIGKNGKRHVAVAAQEFENLVSLKEQTALICTKSLHYY